MIKIFGLKLYFTKDLQRLLSEICELEEVGNQSLKYLRKVRSLSSYRKGWEKGWIVACQNAKAVIRKMLKRERSKR